MQDPRQFNDDFTQKPVESCPKNYKPWIWTLIIMIIITMIWTTYENYQSGGLIKTILEGEEGLATDLSGVYSAAATTQSEPVRKVQNSYHGIIEHVRPAVVSIDAVLAKPVNPPGVAPGLVTPTYTRVGSGVIIEPRGYVLSSLHVIAGAKSLKATVYTKNGAKVYPLKVVNVKKDTDLVLLRIQGTGPFAYAAIGNSDNVRTGDIVLAMGSPFGFDQTITTGIISSTKRTITVEGRVYDNLLQTDTPINKGNSGGPLVNTEGQVIGINNAIYSPNGVSSGIGFALPINQAAGVVGGVVDFRNSPVQAAAGQIVAWQRQGRQSGNTYKLPSGQVVTPPHNYRGKCITCHPQLKNPGNGGLPPDFGPGIAPGQQGNRGQKGLAVALVQQNMPFVGISVIDVDWIIAEHFGLLHPMGVLVERVYDNSPAQMAGVKRSHIIVRIDGKRIHSASEFKDIVQAEKIGKRFDLVIFDRGKRKSVKIDTVAFPEFKRPVRPGQLVAFTWLGSEVTDINSTLSPYIKNGVYVTDADGILGRAGVVKKDIITAINGQTVKDISALMVIAKTVNIWQGLKLDILRQGQNISIDVTGTMNNPVRPAAYAPYAQPVAAPLTNIPAPPGVNRMAKFDWLGSEIVPISKNIAPYVPHGVMVGEVGGVLRRAGVMTGDIIVNFDGATVADIGSFITLTNQANLVKGVLLDILRDGQPMYITVQRGSAFKFLAGVKPNPNPPVAPPPVFNTVPNAPLPALPMPTEFSWGGTEFTTISSALAAYIKHGVYVLEPGGALKLSGVRQGDVLVAINNKKINDITEFIAVAKATDVLSGPVLEIIRSGRAIHLKVRS